MPRYTSNSLPPNTIQEETPVQNNESKGKKKSTPRKDSAKEDLNPKTARLEKISGNWSIKPSYLILSACCYYLIPYKLVFGLF